MAKITKTKGVYLHSEARWSLAYRKLTKVARDLLRLFMEKRQVYNGKIINNGRIAINFSLINSKPMPPRELSIAANIIILKLSFIIVPVNWFMLKSQLQLKLLLY